MATTIMDLIKILLMAIVFHIFQKCIDKTPNSQTALSLHIHQNIGRLNKVETESLLSISKCLTSV